MTDLILAIDPGKTSGAALLTIEANPKLVNCWELEKIEPRMVCRAVADFNHFPDDQIVQAVIEDQWLGKSVKTLKSLVRSRTIWEVACALERIEVEFVAPATWQARELGAKRRGQLKLMSTQKAHSLWKRELTEDQADAALLGRYAAIEMWRKHGR